MKKLIILLLLVLVIGVPLASAKGKGGCVPCLIGVFFGTRAGYMANDGVGIRLFELLMFVPVVDIVCLVIDLVHIYQGTSWSNIRSEATLFTADYYDWHKFELAKSQ
jgi:hypothetical protein